MWKSQEKMEQQYGKTTETRFSNTLLKLINKFWISRVDYSLKLLEKYWKQSWDNILDIGCWNWEFCKKNVGKYKNIYWIDISSSRIEQCKNLVGGENITYMVHDMNEKMEFKDDYFDVVNSLVCFEWIYDLNWALKEVNRILKENWIFILEVNNMWFIYRRLKLLFWYYPETCWFAESEWKNIWWDGSTCHMFTKAEFSRFLKEFWFEVVEVSWTWIFYKLRNWWPSLLCWDLFYVLKKR